MPSQWHDASTPPPSRLSARAHRDFRPRGIVAGRGDHRLGSDVDLLVEMDSRSLLEQASLQGDLEDLLGCPVHVLTTTALRHVREDARERIEREAVSL